MSTIATKFSAAKLQVGTAALAAVVAGATLTPAIADAAPSVSFAPISQALGSTVDTLIIDPVVTASPGTNSAAPGDNKAAADEVGTFAVDPVTGLIQFFGQIIVTSLSFISNIIVGVGEFTYGIAVTVAQALGLPIPPPPYSGT